VQLLRSAGLAVDYPLTPAKGDKQFKRALELEARHTVRLEAQAGLLSVRIKDLRTRAERFAAPEEAAASLRIA
jgi:histidyl-tRNA synthetase